LLQDAKEIANFKYPPKDYVKEIRRNFPIRMIEDFTPDFISRIDNVEWLNELDGNILTLNEVINQFGEYLPEDISKRGMKIPERFLKFIDDFNVYLIQELYYPRKTKQYFENSYFEYDKIRIIKRG